MKYTLIFLLRIARSGVVSGQISVSELQQMKKSRADCLDLTVAIEHDLGKGHWNYVVLLNLRTQLFNNYIRNAG